MDYNRLLVLRSVELLVGTARLLNVSQLLLHLILLAAFTFPLPQFLGK